MRKIAASVDEPRIARRRGASLAKLLLGYWRAFVGRASGADAAAALFALMDEPSRRHVRAAHRAWGGLRGARVSRRVFLDTDHFACTEDGGAGRP